MSFQYVSNDENKEVEDLGESQHLVSPTPKTPIYSYILIGCIILVSIAQLATNLDQSIDIAGFVKPDFLEKHQYWRIFTGAALHGGIIHLAFNSYALYSFGNLIEFLSNKAHLAIVFILAIVGGGLLSLVFSPFNASVGASGGVIGFLGYLAVYAYRRRKLLSPSFLKNLLINIVIIAAYGLLLAGNIDNFAHLGGLITGAIYGFIQVPIDLEKDPRSVSSFTNLIGIIALAFFALVSIFSILLILKIIHF